MNHLKLELHSRNDFPEANWPMRVGNSCKVILSERQYCRTPKCGPKDGPVLNAASLYSFSNRPHKP